MPFGIKKKKSFKNLSVPDSGSSSSEAPPLPLPSSPSTQNFKYGGQISKTCIDIGGLPVNVFGIQELTPSSSRSNAPAPPHVCIVIHLHGRGGSADNEEKISRQLWDRIQRNKNSNLRRQHSQRDHLVVSFDARNHGHRTTNLQGQQAWKHGNKQHALDLYAMIVGGARDTSFLCDFLPSYLFPQDDRVVAEWVVTGKSLGGHSVWHVLANEPRIRIGVPFIGMPSYPHLLASRTRTSFVTNRPPYVPASLKSLVSAIDPSSTDYTSFDARSNPFWGKKICVLSGKEDRLVLWDWNKEFLDGLVVGEPSGPRAEITGLEIHQYQGIGHEVTEEMIDQAGDWIYKYGIVVEH